MKTLKNWVLHEANDQGVTLLVDDQHLLSVYVLEEQMMRVVIRQHQHFSLDRTWSIAPEGEVPWEGRDRLSLAGFSCPAFKMLEQEDGTILLATQMLKVVLSHPLALTWYIRCGETWQLLCKDRSTGAYQLGHSTKEKSHFQQRLPQERYYGLGEKSGNLQRNGGRYEMRNLDAMGYDAAHTDPLYKHLPLLITKNPTASYGIFYDNLASCWFDLGNELDNYHAPYRKYLAVAGDLDYYFFADHKLLNITKQFVRLTGKTIFAPKWSLGYSGSSMGYTDAPDAQHQLQSFADQCQDYGIPCDSFQMSSGYTSIGHKRYVFNWNHDKFPDIHGLTEYFKQSGIRLAANIKPCLLHDHPQYETVKQQGLFVQDATTDSPEISVFWDAEGSHLDFTNPATVKWWQDNVAKQLLDYGIGSTWNDNNEYEIWDNQARCHGFGKPIAIELIRPLMSLLMMRASKEVQASHAPDLRPYLISRSGCAGMQRYVQTWSGDNRTDWQTLRYNIRMGLGMSMSGLYNIGHDVGGFAGDKPEPELLIRWVQNGVMHPRFTIHSWNPDGSSNSPWMYPSALPAIRQAIQLRYQLLPYFYHCLWQSHVADEPMLRPTFWDHEHDAKTFEANDDFLLGKDLLVASVVEKGVYERTVYLPDNTDGWYDYYSHQWLSGGQTVLLAAPLERLPLMVRAGSILPCSQRLAFVDAAQDAVREWHIFPLQYGMSEGCCFDDDGESYQWESEGGLILSWQLLATADRLELKVWKSGHYNPAYQEIVCHLPQHDKRPLWINGQPAQVIKLKDLA